MKVFDSISYVNSWDVVLTPIISPLNFFHSHCHWQIHVDSDTIYLKSAQIVMCFVTVHLHVLCRTQVCKLTRPAGQCTLKAMNINITNNYNGKVKMILILKYFVTWALYCSICILVYFFLRLWHHWVHHYLCKSLHQTGEKSEICSMNAFE